MVDRISTVVTPPQSPRSTLQKIDSSIIPRPNWKTYGNFPVWTLAGESGGVRLRSMSEMSANWSSVANDEIYEIHVRLVGGANCGRGIYGRPPFKNRNQFERWICSYRKLNNILLARWIKELAVMPENKPGNVIIMFIVHVLGKDVRELGHILYEVTAVKMCGIKFGIVKSTSIGAGVRTRHAMRL